MTIHEALEIWAPIDDPCAMTVQDIIERALEAQRAPSPLIQRIAAKMPSSAPERAAKSDAAIGRAITKTANQHCYTTFWADKPGWGDQLSGDE